MQRTVWRLSGSTDKVVECCVDQTASKAHAITVVLGPEMFLHETYPDEASAVRRAMQVRDRLLKGGGWSVEAGPAGAVRRQELPRNPR